MRAVFQMAVLAVLGTPIFAMTEPAVATDTDEAAIRRLWQEASAALCAGDWDRYEAAWIHSPKIQIIDPRQPKWLVGAGAVRSKFRDTLSPDFRCEFATRYMPVSVAPSGEMAWATVETRRRLPNQPEVTLWETAVFEKQAGSWRLVHGHVSSPAAPAARAPTVTKQLKGVLTSSFEHTGFTACNSHETFWFSKHAVLIPGWEKVQAILDARPAATMPITTVTALAYMELKARIMGPGLYGHLGMYTYEVEPLEVIRAESVAPPDCRAQLSRSLK